MHKVTILLILSFLYYALSFGIKEDKRAFQKFQNFIRKYSKIYSSSEEFITRFRIFKESLLKQKIGGRYQTGITQFADLTPEEFQNRMMNKERKSIRKKELQGCMNTWEHQMRLILMKSIR